ncbi:uncharacterized protein si:ch211-81a5.8 [Acanthochromis polyacanthus]|uniref:uncharacterized protein si:ch211-81a5.8 n=1 Tax=Acanthochromis polyacanthus TaxID=80966 RepID=UPI00223434DC|nr:uncharacterized protein si:ch211-81a5.8 [Acanthochromis polyacanthus]
MDSLMSLGAPLKQFTRCVSGKNTTAKRGTKRSQSVRRNSFTRRKSVSRRRSLPCTQKVPDSWLRAYQDDLKKERKRQQAILAKKNAERTVRKTHFRSHHCLPRQTTAARKPAPVKDDSFFGAFQGLSLDGLVGGASGLPAAAAPAAGGGDPCKVM